VSATRVCPTCGYTHTYANDAIADGQFGRHSCAKHQRLARAAQRRAERAAGGPTRDCQHPGHPHEHGTRAAYVKDRCRCRPCTDANTTYDRAAAREQTFGAPSPYVDATQAREHIQMLRRDGVGCEQIAKAVHTSPTHIREIAQSTNRTGNRPPITQIRADLAQRILAVTDRYRSPQSQIDATGTRRRLQALAAVGWPVAALAPQLGRTTTKLRDLFTCDTVQAQTAQRVSDLYDRLWDTPPARDTDAQRRASDEVRVLAAGQGWLPPLAWDDIDTDPDPDPGSPHARPDPDDLDEIAIERAVAGDHIRLAELTPAEQAEVVRRLTERGKSIRDIADQLATTKRTISRRRESAASAA
jgi:AraC-like DNA-binding protein